MQQKYDMVFPIKKLRFISEATDELRRRIVAQKEREVILHKWRILKKNKVSKAEIESVLEVSLATLYRWNKSSMPCSKRPKNVRKPMWTIGLETKVRQLRVEHPLYGKDKIHNILEREGVITSVSTVGRILAKLKSNKQILACHQVSGIKKHRKSKKKERYAKRLPAGKKSIGIGDLVQIDHLQTKVGEKVYRHFNAWDKLSKHNVGGVYSNATSYCAAKFLEELIKESPFDIKSIQVDGGSEFMKDFETACKDKEIELFVLPPNSPKLNGGVERINRTWREEFYDFYDDLPENILQLNSRLKQDQHFYNNQRPLRALDCLTPIEYIYRNLNEENYHMY